MFTHSRVFTKTDTSPLCVFTWKSSFKQTWFRVMSSCTCRGQVFTPAGASASSLSPTFFYCVCERNELINGSGGFVFTVAECSWQTRLMLKLTWNDSRWSRVHFRAFLGVFTPDIKHEPQISGCLAADCSRTVWRLLVSSPVVWSVCMLTKSWP